VDGVLTFFGLLLPREPSVSKPKPVNLKVASRTDEAKGHRLEALGSEIQADVTKFGESAKDALAHALSAGQKLIEAKRICAHGEWLSFLQTRCKVSDGHARRLMRAFKKYQSLRSNRARVSDFGSLRQLLAFEPDDNVSHKNRAKLGQIDPTAIASVSGLNRRSGQPREAATDDDGPGPADSSPTSNAAEGGRNSFIAPEANRSLTQRERAIHFRTNCNLTETERRLCAEIDRHVTKWVEQIVQSADRVARAVLHELAAAEIDVTCGTSVVLSRLLRMLEAPEKPAKSGTKTRTVKSQRITTAPPTPT
jgi:hypothetical protein